MNTIISICSRRWAAACRWGSWWRESSRFPQTARWGRRVRWRALALPHVSPRDTWREADTGHGCCGRFVHDSTPRTSHQTLRRGSETCSVSSLHFRRTRNVLVNCLWFYLEELNSPRDYPLHVYWWGGESPLTSLSIIMNWHAYLIEINIRF